MRLFPESYNKFRHSREGSSVATDYVFAVFLKELKKAWRKDKAQDIIISTLFDAVIISGGLVDQYKDRLVVNKTYASLVFSGLL